MRKSLIPVILTAVLVTAPLLSGCEEGGPIRIASSGDVITEEKDFTGFDSVDVSSAFEVVITRSDNFSVVISADEELHDFVEVTKSGDRLKIYLQPHNIFTDFTTGVKTLKAEITMPVLDTLILGGATSGTIYGFSSGKDFDVDVSGASKLKIVSGGFDDVVFEVSGASGVSGNLTAQKIKAGVSGASNLDVSGSAEIVVLDVSGASKVDMTDFVADDADVEVSGASKATLNVRETLDAELSGASSLYFYGNPEVGDLDVSGASTIKHK
jgi:hypothetical protein